MRSNAGMANRQGDVDWHEAQVSVLPVNTYGLAWLGLAWSGLAWPGSYIYLKQPIFSYDPLLLLHQIYYNCCYLVGTVLLVLSAV